MSGSFRTLFLASAFFLVSAFSCAAADQTSPILATKKSKAATSQRIMATKIMATKKGPTVEGRLEQVTQQIKEQQSQIQQQQTQIQDLLRNNAELHQQVQEQGHVLQNSLQNTSQQAATADESVKNLALTVTALQTDAAVTKNAFVENKRAVDALQNPLAIHYKGLTITPGGWVESTLLVRSRNENADLTSNFGSAPFNGVANSNLSEFRTTARGTRPILVATAMVGSTKLTGYFEMDFLGQAPTSNQLETNSFVPRQRQLWMQAEFKNGLTFTAGQFWSLMTTDRKGIATRSEFIPTTLEGSYVIGYTYVRQDAFRIVKNFSNKTWAGFEVANSETSLGTSYTPANVMGFNNSPNAGTPNGSTLNYLAGSANGLSTNLAPDFIGKIAFEPGYGHFEIKALARVFRDRIATTSTTPGTTNVTAGGGIGWAAILPITKKADFIFEGLVGKGIGRYGASNTPDVTLRPDGAIIPLADIHSMAGFELHPRPKLDLFFYGGDEYVGSARYTTVNASGVTVAAGYGSALVNNTNCNLEVIPEGGAACGAQNKNLYDATAGFWYRIYKGPFGTLQYGSQFAYIHRTTWAGKGGAPTGDDVVGLTGVRLYLP